MGNEASVLVGDFLFARAFELMVEAGDINVLGRLANASAQITEGEIKQMTIAGRPDTPNRGSILMLLLAKQPFCLPLLLLPGRKLRALMLMMSW